MNDASEIKALLVDYGGTLDTDGCHWGRKIWHAYQTFKVPVDWEAFRQAYIYAERYLGSHRVVMPDFTFRRTLSAKIKLQLQYLADNGLVALTAANLGTLHYVITRELYYEVQQTTARSYDVLRSIDMPKVLVSNFYGNVATVLHEFGFDGLFDSIVESAVVGVRKPDPRIFALGAEMLDLQPQQVAVVGDSLDKDIAPAKSIGCATVWFKGEQWDDAPADTSPADHIITDIRQLAQLPFIKKSTVQ